ncbi:Conserved_hypothetical protein [Hexamita inflata]|uniref:Uncharacterized protein n=1 Tax=Hexamita inflata TaxID=28002 RepID=A0AA86NIH1_9EUKA|nr:Conserved hypothetical protein [Hexamita inflata]
MTQSALIDISINNAEVNNFSLFGLNLNKQIIMDSNINISLNFKVLTGALLCTICNIEINKCSLIFIASGQQISGIIIESQLQFIVQESMIQYRISSINSSGFINVINTAPETLIISQCTLVGFNVLQSKCSGYLLSQINVDISINIIHLSVCVDSTPRFGKYSTQIKIIGNETTQCNICGDLVVVYGLCLESLLYGHIENGVFKCVFPFEYRDNACICAYGYLINGTKCINIVDAITNMQNSDNSSQLQILEANIDKIYQALNSLDKYIYNNVTDIQINLSSNIDRLEHSIISNFSKSDYNLQTNTTVLDKRIFENITGLKSDIQKQYNLFDINLLQNTTNLDWQIFNNISYIKEQMLSLNQSIVNLNQTIQQQQGIINDLTQQLNCKCQGKFTNGKCVQDQCTIQGQQIINGTCQCTNTNSVVDQGSCVCPLNSVLVGSACVCREGQKMQNGICVCETTGAVIYNGACTCGMDSFNISNICSCPSHSNLVGNVCTCQYTGQQMINKECKCSPGYTIINNSCQQASYIINVTELAFQCSQTVYITTFDMLSLTHQIQSSTNFRDHPHGFWVFYTTRVLRTTHVQCLDQCLSIINIQIFIKFFIQLNNSPTLIFFNVFFRKCFQFIFLLDGFFGLSLGLDFGLASA